MEAERELTVAEINDLEAKARAATSGPWQAHESSDGIAVLYLDHEDGDDEGTPYPYDVCLCEYGNMDADSAYITAFDPPTALALCTMAKDKIAAEERVWELEAARVVDKSINLPKAEPFFVTQESFDGLCEQIQKQCDFINALTTRLWVPNHLPSLAAVVDWIEARVFASLSAEKEEERVDV